MTRLASDQNLRLADVQVNCKYGNFKTSTKNLVAQGVGVLNSVIGLFMGLTFHVIARLKVNDGK